MEETMANSETNDSISFLEQLRRSVTKSGFSSFLGADPIKCSGGEAELVIPLKEQLTQHHGFLGERLRAHGKVIKKGKRQLTVRADVFAEQGDEVKLVATALASIAIVGRIS